jgi:hypothetical protein
LKCSTYSRYCSLFITDLLFIYRYFYVIVQIVFRPDTGFLKWKGQIKPEG